MLSYEPTKLTPGSTNTKLDEDGV